MSYEERALEYHKKEPAGKIGTKLTKNIDSQDELSMAYSPGVAGPCRKIHENPELAFKYTGRGNLVGVISNGTAVLGLGDIGPEAAKPVMEGKAMLFKKFADIDVFDIEVDAKDPEEFIRTVKSLEPTFGGINLEDIKAPECFYIEEKLRELMTIPVFHDDQHGTAIIASAAFINALEITGKRIEDVKVVFSGAGAAAIACAKLFFELGVQPKNLIMCDSKGVIHTGREDGMNEYKKRFACETDDRTLGDAIKGADAFVGVSSAGVLTEDMVKAMEKDPIIFALANPDPEILPDVAKAVRPDAIVATGRSDFPNQVNNVLGFPFIFRGALDVHATEINEEMKRAAVLAIANLAKMDVPEEVLRVYKKNEGYSFGRDYLIPKPIDPRVLLYVAPAVASAAMESGVARKQIPMDQYIEHIEKILGPTKRIVRQMIKRITKKSQTRKPIVVIPHGYDHRVIKAVTQISQDGVVDTIILGSKENTLREAAKIGINNIDKYTTIIDPQTSSRAQEYADRLFEMRARKGVSRTAALQMIRDKDYFAAMMVSQGAADGMVTGLVKPYAPCAQTVLKVLGSLPGTTLSGTQMIVHEKKVYFFADCTININPTPEQLADIAIVTADLAKKYTDEPIKVALLSFSSFGGNRHNNASMVAEAAAILRQRDVDFSFDGEIQADAALNTDLQNKEFPFCNLKGRANVLIFPDLTSANITYKTLAHLPKLTTLGPILSGVTKPAHILERGASTEETINMIYLTADQAFSEGAKKS
ncbi:MAG: NADP-dependent malic enzyme [Zetaproteobacteria bacterium]|nr:NADP-dependent malic enzyme [Pseudobdellovibrionaceae bacterium]